MAIQSINLGTAPSGAGGDTSRSANIKINENFTNNENAASKLIGTSGNTVPVLNAANSWSLHQTFSIGATIGGAAAYPALRILANSNVPEGTIGFSTALESSAGSSFYVTYRDKAESSNGRITVYFPRSSGTLAIATSDERIKDKVGIVNDDDCMARLKNLELWDYTLKVGMSANPEACTFPRRGFMAQQANSVDNAYCLPPNSEGEYWGIDDRAIIADLVGAIRVLQKEIENLKEVVHEPQ